MRLIPYDRGTYLVESRRDPEVVYLVDVLEQHCTCDGFLLGDNLCAHLTAATAWHFGICELTKAGTRRKIGSA
jgi:hypothetical protein